MAILPAPELSGNALVVSDSHIGGDPGCDGFESPAESGGPLRGAPGA